MTTTNRTARADADMIALYRDLTDDQLRATARLYRTFYRRYCSSRMRNRYAHLHHLAMNELRTRSTD